MFSVVRSKVLASLQAFRRRTEGFAAVEFAMVVPIMITMFIGTVEMSEAYTLARRVVTISGSVADLVTQSSSVKTADLQDIMRIADSLLAGYDPSPLQVVIVSVIANAEGKVLVDWSYDRTGGAPYPPGAEYNDLPTGLIGAGQSVVVAQVKYAFDPPIGKYILGSVNLIEKFHLQPRQSTSVAREL
jgi:Flp pilus assembly protein TadG